jgi:hypothetical protein
VERLLMASLHRLSTAPQGKTLNGFRIKSYVEVNLSKGKKRLYKWQKLSVIA